VSQLGTKLKEARRELGLSVEEVAAETGIQVIQIKALEDEDFSIFFDRKQASKVLDFYGKLLKLDSKELTNEFNNAWSDANTARAYIQEALLNEEVESTSGYTGSSKILIGISIIIVLALFAVGINKFFLQQPIQQPVAENNAQVSDSNKDDSSTAADDQNHDSNEGPASSVDSSEKDSQEEGLIDQKPEAIEFENPVNEKIEVEVFAARGDCWLEAVVDGEKVFYRTIKQEEEPLVFTGEEVINVVIGNAAVVDVKYNGESLGSLGKDGEVVKKVFYPESK